MRTYLLLGAALALASCVTQKAVPKLSEEQKRANELGISYWQPDSAKAIPKLSPAAQRKLEARRRRGQAPLPLASDGGPRPLDSTVAIPYATPQPGRSTAFWQKVNPFRSKPVATEKLVEASLPRKCKGCTFNVVAGNQTVAGKKAQVAAGAGATASVIEKKAGPAVVASDSSTSNAILGGGNIQATNGNNNTPQLTAPVQQASDWRATLAKPVGYAVASLGSMLVVAGCIYLFAAYKRRKALQA